MMAAQGLGAQRGKVLKLTNSGDVTGRKSPGNYVVGYMAAVFYQTADKSEEGLTEEEKRLLHRIARMAIEDMARGGNRFPSAWWSPGLLWRRRGPL
jgi:hypothetical protein